MNTSEFIEQLYLSLFRRKADAGGKAFWANALDSGLVPRDSLASHLMNSAEFHDLMTYGAQRGGGASIVSDPFRAPRLLSSTPADNTTSGIVATNLVVYLNFSEPMARGNGTIYVTDGAIQTAISPGTGQPFMRIIGATETHAISVASVSDVQIVNHQVQLHMGTALKPGVTYSLIMDPGVLVDSSGTPFAGFSDHMALNFTPSGETIAPVVTALSLGRSEIRTGDTMTVQVIFSEAVSQVDASDFTTPSGTLGSFTSSSGGTVWQASFTPTAGIADSSNVITINAANVSDLAGNAGSGSTTSANYAVDTIVNAVVSTNIAFIDAGPYTSDLVTNVTGQTFSGSYTGTLELTDRIELVVNGVTVDSNLIMLDRTLQTWSFTGGTFTAGNNTVLARAVSSDGHESTTVSKTLVIDNTAPLLTSPAGVTSFNVVGDLVLTFDEAVYWEDSGSTMNISGNSQSVTVLVSEVQLSTDRKTLTIPAAAHEMLADANYTLSLPAALTDLAGNSPAPGPITINTTLNPSPPSASGVSTATADGTYGIGAAIALVVTFDEMVKVFGNPRIQLSTGAVNQYATYFSGDGTNSLTFKYTVQAGDVALPLAILNTSGLIGKITDLNGGLLDNAHILFSGFAGYGPNIHIDGVAPTAPSAAPDLDATSDNGAFNSDNITGDLTPTFIAAGVTALAEFQLFKDGTLVGSNFSDEGGNLSITSSLLTAGTYSFTLKELDTADNVSPASAALSVTLTDGPLLDSYTAASGTLYLNFTEDISFAAGAIKVYDSNNALVQTYLASDTSQDFWRISSGTPARLELEPVLSNGNNFANGTYHLRFDANAVKDVSDNYSTELVGTPGLEFIIFHV